MASEWLVESVRMLLHKRISGGRHERPTFGQTREAVVLRQLGEGPPGDFALPIIQSLVADVLEQQARAVVERAVTHLVVPRLIAPRHSYRDVLDHIHADSL